MSKENINKGDDIFRQKFNQFEAETNVDDWKDMQAKLAGNSVADVISQTESSGRSKVVIYRMLTGLVLILSVVIILSQTSLGEIFFAAAAKNHGSVEKNEVGLVENQVDASSDNLEFQAKSSPADVMNRSVSESQQVIVSNSPQKNDKDVPRQNFEVTDPIFNVKDNVKKVVNLYSTSPEISTEKFMKNSNQESNFQSENNPNINTKNVVVNHYTSYITRNDHSSKDSSIKISAGFSNTVDPQHTETSMYTEAQESFILSTKVTDGTKVVNDNVVDPQEKIGLPLQYSVLSNMGLSTVWSNVSTNSLLDKLMLQTLPISTTEVFSKKLRLSIHAGLRYHTLTSETLHESSSYSEISDLLVTFSGGISAQYVCSKKHSFSLGLVRSRIRTAERYHLSDIHQTIISNSASLNWRYRRVMHHIEGIELPFKYSYRPVTSASFLNKCSINLGVVPTYLYAVNTFNTEVKQSIGDYISLAPEGWEEPGFNEGINYFDLGLLLGASYNFTDQLSIEGIVQFGLRDITDDTFWNIDAKYDRNSSIQIRFAYNFFEF